jgi:G3E family GTPase
VNEAMEQIAFADRLILNKTDLVSEAELIAVRSRIRALNELAEIKTAINAVRTSLNTPLLPPHTPQWRRVVL